MDDLDTLKRNTNLVNILESYGVEGKWRGQEWHYKCFTHNDHTPSAQVFTTSDGTQRWHCKTCGGNGGTVIDAVAILEGVSIADAIKRIKANHFQSAPNPRNPIMVSKPKSTGLWQHTVTPDTMPVMDYDKDLGAPIRVWRYNNADGQCVGYVARYIRKSDGRKDYRPFTYGRESENVALSWKAKMWTAGQRPLYGLDLLAKEPKKGVLIVEGE